MKSSIQQLLARRGSKFVEELVRNRSQSSLSAAAQVQSGYTETLSPLFQQTLDDAVDGKVKLHKLENILDPSESVLVRRRVISERTKDRSAMSKLPAFGDQFNATHFYKDIHGANCENVVGFMTIPVGVVGPLLLNDKEYYVPMSTTEGALLASTQRGSRAIQLAGGAHARVVNDVMSRAPVVELESAVAAAEFAEKIKDPAVFQQMKEDFSTTTNFGQLVSVTPTVAGRRVYLRFSASTGDAMGMNMVGKGVNVVIQRLLSTEKGVRLVALSSNMCTDKKPSAMNWVNGRGKSVVCEAFIKADIVENVLNTSVKSLVQTHKIKNFIGSSLAGSIGGNNAHASNIVTAIFLATGQDPAQNVESSNCLLDLEELENGDLHASATMPSIEVGTVGGGTTLPTQRACLDMLGVGGANRTSPGDNARELAQIVATTVLAGELSLNAALASNELISAHMDLNRKPGNTPESTSTKSAESATPGVYRPVAQQATKRTSLLHDVPKTAQHKRQFVSARRFDPDLAFSKAEVVEHLLDHAPPSIVRIDDDDDEPFEFPRLPVP